MIDDQLVRLIQDAFGDCSWNNYERPPVDVCAYLIHRLRERGVIPASPNAGADMDAHLERL